MKKKIIHYPILSNYDCIFVRFFGPGLGNLIFPLYRAFQAQKKYGGELVFPQFFQIKIGTLYRREKDKRNYMNLFKKRAISEVFLHFIAIVHLNKRNETILSDTTESNKKNKNCVIRYEGICNCFINLNDKYRREFVSYLMSKAKGSNLLKQDVNKINRKDIAVHIRRGDFRSTSNHEENGQASILIEDDWYIEAVKKAKKISPNGKIRIFTDDNNLDKALLEKLDCYEVDSSINALHSILKMSKHGYLIASRSTFSLWSAYLGDQCIIIQKEFNIEKYMNVEEMRVIKL